MSCGLLAGCAAPSISGLIDPRYPKYIYTESRTELVFDGDTIVIEGKTRCERNSLFNAAGEIVVFADKVGPLYVGCKPRWFGHRLPDGGALIVSPFGLDGEIGQRSFPDLSKPEYGRLQARLDASPRTVIWLNDARSPNRGEYYFSTIALDDPASRLTSVKSQILSISSSSTPQEGYVKIGNIVPWLSARKPEPNDRLESYYMTVIPKSIWSRVSGLEDRFRQFTEPTLLNRVNDLPRRERLELGAVAALVSEKIRRTFQNESSSEELSRPRRYRQYIPVDGYMRVDDTLPKGVLHLFALSIRHNPNFFEIDIGNSKRKIPAKQVWRKNNFLYEPEGEKIYGFFLTTFRPKID